MSQPVFLACDWGTTNLRAWVVGEDGKVARSRDFPLGISKLAPGEAARRFRDEVRPGLVAEDLPGPGTVFLQVSWAFRAPARPGDTITAEVEVLGRRDDKPIATLRTTITNQRGEVLVDGTAVVYRERTVAESASGRLGPWVGGSGSRQG